ncbi:MAG: aldo/keto reductase [Rickettsiales bacterium]|nr:aldo/keto reductase [Rickettsiales bacterium]
MQMVKLNNGVEMPILGFGVFQIPIGVECEKAVSEAIKVGYRLFDTAQAYGNEADVGNAIKKSGIDRKEFFVVTKVWISNCGEERAYRSILESLKKLQMDYVDLLLIHQPFGDYYGTYRALERAYREGKTRAIGVSNFYPDRFVDLCHFVEVKPMVNQVETHVFNQQHRANEIMKKYNCQIMSWGPFAEGKNNLFTNEILTEIGKKYNKVASQVALRFLIDENVIVIPKSVKPERMVQNFDVFDFKLSADDMEKIHKLDMSESLFINHHSADAVEYLIGYKI